MRAVSLAVLLSFLFVFQACTKEVSWEFYLADPAGNRLDSPLTHGQKAKIVYRQGRPFRDQIAFQFYFQDEAERWRLISAIVEKPETPAPEVCSDLHVEDLSPGRYRVVVSRNDEELSELVFTVSPSPATPAQAKERQNRTTGGGEGMGEQKCIGGSPAGGRQRRAVPTMTPPRAEDHRRRAVSPAVAASEGGSGKQPAQEFTPTPENDSYEAYEPETIPTPEGGSAETEAAAMPEGGTPAPAGKESAAVSSSRFNPDPTPEPEILQPGAWDLKPGTEVLVLSQEDGYWYPASITDVSGPMFTVHYFDGQPDEVVQREDFRVQSLSEGMKVKFRAGENNLIDAVVVTRYDKKCTIAVDGNVRDVSYGAIVVSTP